jgi:zinc and cadmium transporter
MTASWTYPILSVLGVSALPLMGVLAFALRQERLQKIVLYLVSLAVGGLLGAALLHLLPEAFARAGGSTAPSVYVLVGFVGFFVFEKFLWTHRHITPEAGAGLPPLAILNLAGDGLHNFVDGMVIAASFSANPALGLSTTLAVVLHEVPRELGDFGVLIYSGMSIRKAVLWHLAAGSMAVVGTLVTLIVGHWVSGMTAALLPMAAGNFIYIAAADLIPELHREGRISTSVWQVVVVLLGIALMASPLWGG